MCPSTFRFLSSGADFNFGSMKANPIHFVISNHTYILKLFYNRFTKKYYNKIKTSNLFMFYLGIIITIYSFLMLYNFNKNQ